MKFYFCELFNIRLKEVEEACAPIVKVNISRIRQSYNRQQHTVRVEAWVEHAFVQGAGLEVCRTFWNLLHKRFHSIILFKHKNFRIVHHFYPPIVATEKGWGASSIDDYTEGFSRKVRGLMKSHYIRDRVEKTPILYCTRCGAETVKEEPVCGTCIGEVQRKG